MDLEPLPFHDQQGLGCLRIDAPCRQVLTDSQADRRTDKGQQLGLQGGGEKASK